MDPIIVLTPVAVLAIVLLLGFAGCDRVFGLQPVPLPPEPYLTLRVWVPTALTVREIVLSWDPPDATGGSMMLTKPTPTGFEGDRNFFDHELTGERADGPWTARCLVKVTGGTGAGAQGEGSFTLDGSFTDPVATFVGMGDAPGLTVVFDMVYEKS